MTDETQTQVHFEHRFKSAPERVYQAWVNPAISRQWMFGSRVRPETVLNIQIDPRVGGSFLFSVERDEKIFDYVGEYFVVEPPERLVFTWAGDQNSTESDHVIVTFHAEKGGCRLTLDHNVNPNRSDHASDIFRDWPAMFDALEKILAGR